MPTVPKREQFFFINKSEKSTYLSRSLPFEKAAAQRHVQSGRKRTRRAKKPQSSTVDELVHRPRSTVASSSSRQQGSRPRNDTTADTDADANDLNPSSAGGRSVEHVQMLPDEPIKVTSLDFQRVLYKQDPFNATCIPLDKHVAGLIHYYMFYYHPSQWPNEMVLLRHGIYLFHGAVLNIVKSAIADELSMYCLLSSAVCRLQYIDQLPCSLVAGAESHYMSKAVQLMSAYIANGNFEEYDRVRQLLVCIGFLNSAEAYRGNLAASRTHFNASVQLLKPKGGLSFVKDESMQGQLAMADLFLACVNLEPCLFDCSYNPGPAKSLNLSNDEQRISRTTSTAFSLLRRPDTFILPELEILIEQLVESHSIKSSILTNSMTATRATQVTHWITLRNMAIRHGLLAIRTDDPRNHSLRIAVIMWSLFSMNVTGRARTVKVMAPMLKDSLDSASSSCWTGSEDVRFWISLVGLFCASDHSEALAWFANECCSLKNCCVASIPDPQGVACLAKRLEAFQRNFFFDEDIQKPRTYALAEKLQRISGGLGS